MNYFALDDGIIGKVTSIFSRKPIITAMQKRHATAHEFSIREKTWKNVLGELEALCLVQHGRS